MNSHATDAIFGPSETRAKGPLSGPRRLAVALFIVLCLGGGSFLRFHNIGKAGFWIDEFFHVYAAQSYLKDGSLTVPLHGEYTQDFAITRITAWSFEHFGVSETSARAPFAAINVLFLGVSFLFIRRIFGLVPALATLCVLSFSPFMIHMSRECRMYTAFQLLYFSWLATFLLGFEPDKERSGWEGRLGIDARWLAASIALFPMSVNIHRLTWNGGLVIGVYLAIMFAWAWFSRGPRAALSSKYGAGLLLTGVAGAAMVLFAQDRLSVLLWAAREVPAWMVLGPNPQSFYRYLLASDYPIFFLLYPLACFAFVRKHGRRGLFAVVSFALLFVLHSYVYGRKEDRYIFYVFPFFILVSASLSATLVSALTESLRSSLAGTARWVRAAAWMAIIPAVYLVFLEWFTSGLRAPDFRSRNDWKKLAVEVRDTVSDNTVIDTNPLAYLYYMGRLPDFYLLGEVWDVNAHQGRLIRTLEDLKAALDRPGIATLITHRERMGNPAWFTPDMAKLIESRTRVVVSRINPSIRYYEELPAGPPPPTRPIR